MSDTIKFVFLGGELKTLRACHFRNFCFFPGEEARRGVLPFEVSLLTGLWFRRAAVKVGASEQHLYILWKLRTSVSWASVQHLQMSKDEHTQWRFRRAAQRICVVETGLWSPATVLPRIVLGFFVSFDFTLFICFPCPDASYAFSPVGS